MEKVKESPVTLDPSGDLLLIVNQAERQKTFRVYSFAMCLASPVWRAMLSPSGNFKEAHPKNGEVSFPEDDPDAMFIVLSAVHYQFQHIPEDLSSENLLNLGIVCDKYDVAKLMLPWLQSRWLKSFQSDNSGNPILLAWQFQDLETFKKLVDQMVRDSKANKLGTLEVKPPSGMNSKKVEELSSGLLKDIVKARAAGIEALRIAIQRCIDRFMKPAHYQSDCRLDRKECDFVIIGAFLYSTGDAGWMPILGNTLVGRGKTQSLNSLIKCLQSIEFLPYSRHESCLSTFREKWDEELAAAIKAIPRGYSDVHLAHFGGVTQMSTSHPLVVSIIKSNLFVSTPLESQSDEIVKRCMYDPTPQRPDCYAESQACLTS